MSDRLDEKVIFALKRYEPRPGSQFYRRMESAPWRQKHRGFLAAPARRFAVAALMTLVVLAIFTISVPTVRAAVFTFLGLSRSESETMPNPPIPAESLVDSRKVEEVAALAGWTIKVPAWLPDGYKFSSAMYDASNRMVLLSFVATRPLPGGDPGLTETKAITLIQAQHNDVLPLMVAPGTAVSDIAVNGQPSAYAIGAWESDAAGGQATWSSLYPLQNVYWQVDDLYLSLNTDDSLVSQADLIKVAESTR